MPGWAGISGFLVPITNCAWSIGSEVTGELAVGHPFAAYYYDGKDDRLFGLRSSPDGMDVA